jgi:hypothetical protein
MKSLKTYLMAVAALMLATACSSEDPVNVPTQGETDVTFTVDVPATIKSHQRTAFADGTSATRLSYALYKLNDETGAYDFVAKKTGLDIIDLQATVTLNLLSGEDYAVAFWAAAKDAPYEFDAENATLKVNYPADALANDEHRDAFYSCVTFTAGANASQEVMLTRPFAQLNIGTSDFELARRDANFVATKSQVKVYAYDQFDLLTGDVTADATYAERTFTFNTRPQGEAFPVEPDTYDYLSMNYLLMPANDQMLSNVTFTVQDQNGNSLDRSYEQIPLQRNYRTNIYGALLTSTTTFQVSISPYFETEYYNREVVEVATSEQLIEECSKANTYVNFVGDPGKRYALPDEIAEGVTINANGAQLATSATSNVITSDNVHIVNAVLVSKYASPLTISADGFIAEDCTVWVNGDGAAMTTGVEATFKNCNFVSYGNEETGKKLYGGSHGIAAAKDAVINLENCTFRDDIVYAVYSYGDYAVNATGCTFNGWLSGWQKGGTFTDCTFAHGYFWYPCAVCYGVTTFNNCKFEWLGKSHQGGDTALDGTTYGFNYIVSGPATRIDINNCTWYSDIAEYNGKAISNDLYAPYYGDSKNAAEAVYVDGVKVYPTDTEAAADIRRR